MGGRKKKSSADLQRELDEVLASLGAGGEARVLQEYREYDALRRKNLSPSEQERMAAVLPSFRTGGKLNGLRKKIRDAQTREAKEAANAVVVAPAPAPAAAAAAAVPARPAAAAVDAAAAPIQAGVPAPPRGAGVLPRRSSASAVQREVGATQRREAGEAANAVAVAAAPAPAAPTRPAAASVGTAAAPARAGVGARPPPPPPPAAGSARPASARPAAAQAPAGIGARPPPPPPAAGSARPASARPAAAQAPAGVGARPPLASSVAAAGPARPAAAPARAGVRARPPEVGCPGNNDRALHTFAWRKGFLEDPLKSRRPTDGKRPAMLRRKLPPARQRETQSPEEIQQQIMEIYNTMDIYEINDAREYYEDAEAAKKKMERNEELSKFDRLSLGYLGTPEYLRWKEIADLQERLRLARQRERDEAIDVDAVDSSASGASSAAIVPSRPASNTASSPVPSIRPNGLINLGHTCYLNVLIQMSFRMELFRNAILECELLESVELVAKEMSDMDLPSPKSIGHQAAVTTPLMLARALRELKELFRSMMTQRGNAVIDPSSFVKELGLDPNRDECALETWTLLFNFYMEFLEVASHYQAKVVSRITEKVPEGSSASPRSSDDNVIMSPYLSVNPALQ